MLSDQRYRASALSRVRQFLDAHAGELGTVNESDARKRVDAAVAQLETVVNVQGTRHRDMKGVTARKRASERELVRVHMAPITRFARAKLKGVPEFAALIPAVKRLSGQKLVDAARSMASAAAPWSAVFAKGSFPADFLTQLTSVADAVSVNIGTRSQKKGERVNATKAVATLLTDARGAVAEIDAAIQRFLVGNPALAEEWRVAKRVEDKPGVPTGTLRIVPASPVATPAKAA